MRRSRALIALLVATVASTAVGLPAVADLNLVLDASAQVAYTNGDGVNVRDAPGFNGGVITALGEGVEVVVHDGPVAANDGTYWYYISSGGAEGWVIADYLALPGGQSAETIWGEIAWTGGDGVNVRAQAGFDGAVVTTLHEGASIAILGGPEWDAEGNAWTLVDFEGVQGWVLDSFVAWNVAADANVERVLDGGWTAYVANTEGAGLRLRGAAAYDAETLVVMPEGAAVTVYGTQIYGGDGAEWWNVEYEGILGYAMGFYFATEEAAAAPAEEAPAEEAPAEDSGLAVSTGTNAVVTGTGGEGLNVRYEWGYSSGVATWLAEGTVVWVVDGPVWGDDGSPWFQVDAAGVVGWVHGGFLATTDQAPDEAVGVAVADPEPVKPANSGNPVGNSIVAEALQYVGLPYVWGGTTPSGFDCSGFVHYVMTQILGYEFTRALEVQATSGKHVDPANLKPGDLVFFQNTYTWGLSHTGIFIGDGQFVHAGSERTGVTISNMWDDYWGSRYYTARRVRN